MSLETLPYDILFSIALFLDAVDIVNLGRISPGLHSLCSEPTLCRRVVENCAPHSLEVKSAAGSTIDYRQVLRRIHRRREAFSKGSPEIAATLGSASSFVYRQGVVAFLNGPTISIVDVQDSGKRKDFHVREVLPDGLVFADAEHSVSLLHYSDGYLSLLLADAATQTELLLVVEVFPSSDRPPRRSRVVQLDVSRKLFVRNDTDFLYFGTHSFVGTHGHQEWIIQGLALNDKLPFIEGARTQTRTVDNEYESIRIHLSDFVGSDIRSTAAFQIHEGYFYAITNCDDFEVVEVDWTSFYHCFKFPVHDPSFPNIQTNHTLYRRQHREGPINDSWLDLDLQVDERTNKLMIVEARKEWLGGQSQAFRTFYISDLEFPERKDSGDEEEDTGESSVRGAVPQNSRLGAYATSSSKYAPGTKRKMWQTHPESMHWQSGGRKKPYILAHTKFRLYNLAADTFIDVVEDTDCCSHGLKWSGRHSCLRLRAGARTLIDPLVAQCEIIRRDESNPDRPQNPTTVTTKDAYRYRPISLWPKPAHVDDLSAAVHDVLSPLPSRQNPGWGTGISVQAASDERTLVMLVRGSASGFAPDAQGKLICLSFDSEAGIGVRNELSAKARKGRRHSSDSMLVEMPAGKKERRIKGKAPREKMSFFDLVYHASIDDCVPELDHPMLG